MNRNYFGFQSWDDVMAQFEVAASDTLPEPVFVWAIYNMASYEGDAVVVYATNDQWFMAHGAHCSCYGLEGQWSAEPFNPELYFSGREKGYWMLPPVDTEGDCPAATQEAFDTWLRACMEAHHAWLRACMDAHHV